MSIFNPDITHGPSTVLCIFGYGGIYPQVAMATIADVARAGNVTGMAAYKNEVIKWAQNKGINYEDLPGTNIRSWPLSVMVAHEDAAIYRSRAVAVKNFLESSAKHEVMIMVDHDIDWQPCHPNGMEGINNNLPYEGDLLYLARKCAETRSIVGAAVSKKCDNQGIASMLKSEGEFTLGSDQLVDAWFPGAGLLAIHREVLEAMYAAYPDVCPGFSTMFEPCTVTHPTDPNQKLQLSEDWAFCHRARQLGFESQITMKCLTQHWAGGTAYTVAGNAYKDSVAELKKRDEQVTNTQPIISIVHATRGRPEQAKLACNEWMSKSSKKHKIEYIFSVDEDDQTMLDFIPPEGAVVVRGPSKGNVDAYNRGLYFSSGSSEVIIQGHDDTHPPENWDELILQRIGDTSKPAVLQVSDGTNANPSKPWLLTIFIATRAYLRQCGYMYHPDIVSVFCDDHISLKARRDNVVIEAKDLLIQHDWEGPSRDETQKRSYSEENWKLGQAVFEREQAAGFPSNAELWRGK